MKKMLMFTAILLLASTLFTITTWAALTQTQVSQLYVGVMGRAAEGDGNRYWQTDPSSTDMTTTANIMLNTSTAKEYFGDKLYDNRLFIEHIYLYTFGKTYSDDPNGIDYWIGELDAGYSKARTIHAIITAVQHPDNADSGQARFLNRVAVSNYCADNIASFTDQETFEGFISGVTNDSATVTNANAAVDEFALGNVDGHLLIIENKDSQVRAVYAGDSGSLVFIQNSFNGNMQIDQVIVYEGKNEIGQFRINPSDNVLSWHDSVEPMSHINKSSVLNDQAEYGITRITFASSSDQIFIDLINKSTDQVIAYIQEALGHVHPIAQKRANELSKKLEKNKQNPDKFSGSFKEYITEKALNCYDNSNCIDVIVTEFRQIVGRDDTSEEDASGNGDSENIYLSLGDIGLKDSSGNEVSLAELTDFSISTLSGQAPLSVYMEAKTLNYNNSGLSHSWTYDSVDNYYSQDILFGAGSEAHLELTEPGEYKITLSVSYSRGGGVLGRASKIVVVEAPIQQPFSVDKGLTTVRAQIGSTCEEPVSKNVFDFEGEYVALWIKYSNAEIGKEILFNWISPNGTIVYYTPNKIDYTSGCTLASMNKNEIQAYGSGQWSVKLYYDGHLYKTNRFKIEEETKSMNTITWAVTDRCDDGYYIEYRFWSRARNVYWGPYNTTIYGDTDRKTLNCEDGEKICFGGKTGSKSWGVGYDGKNGSDTGCYTCNGGTYTYNPSCGSTTPVEPLPDTGGTSGRFTCFYSHNPASQSYACSYCEWCSMPERGTFYSHSECMAMRPDESCR